MNGIGDIAAKLADIPLFEGLAPDLLADLARASHVARLPKGALLYSAGEQARVLFHVLSGQLKVAVSSSDGGEKVIDVVAPGHNIGMAELFGGVPYVSFAETVAPSLVLHISREAILRVVDRDPRISRRLLRAIGERQSALERDIASSSFKSGCRRVVDYLLRQAETCGDGPDATVELGMPKHLLAARLGFTPETLSRAFRYLSEAGLISVRGKQVKLSPKLMHTADNDEVDSVIRQPAAGDAWRDRAVRAGGSRVAAWA
ncbi:MAG TPA: Crp/Fnr family transcriptional regulator [Rhodocyclaceae bacterium]|nr:Crp/Fnr family transcriptional regulator [Rhodocyclaceae bacterium]HMV54127.1 Crp/Fnr family transcriptional regulator [Rhodocyclaceae bacterium]HNC62267.1 Crp/Fnr family transcriptional regulator [Rhodocyclaceae bacterium]